MIILYRRYLTFINFKRYIGRYIVTTIVLFLGKISLPVNGISFTLCDISFAVRTACPGWRRTQHVQSFIYRLSIETNLNNMQHRSTKTYLWNFYSILVKVHKVQDKTATERHVSKFRSKQSIAAGDTNNRKAKNLDNGSTIVISYIWHFVYEPCGCVTNSPQL